MALKGSSRVRYGDTESGFTLIELLVVILIIGILAAIAIPMFLNQRKAAADASLRSDIRTMALSLETWQVQTGKLVGDMPAEERFSGWAIMSHGESPVGILGAKSPHVPAGFEAPLLSEGNSVGVVAQPDLHEDNEKGYCILGNNAGGTYNEASLTGEGSAFRRFLYYDSLLGGFHEPDSLPEGGACDHYHDRIANGN